MRAFRQRLYPIAKNVFHRQNLLELVFQDISTLMHKKLCCIFAFTWTWYREKRFCKCSDNKNIKHYQYWYTKEIKHIKRKSDIFLIWIIIIIIYDLDLHHHHCHHHLNKTVFLSTFFSPQQATPKQDFFQASTKNTAHIISTAAIAWWLFLNKHKIWWKCHRKTRTSN